MNEFIEYLVAQMTLAEKVGQLNLVNPGEQTLTGTTANTGVAKKIAAGGVGMMFGTRSRESRREIQKICVEQTRLKIPMLFASDVIHGYRTAFPLPIALSCTWNLAMIERASYLAAREARADGIQLTFAPMVDVSRDPRWGRVAEGAGESPRLGAMIAAAAVRGFQGDGVESTPEDIDRMLACVKHYVGYGAADGGRDYAAVNIGPVELHQSHLPPFKAAVDAGVASLMPGFHTIDRMPMTASIALLRTVLRDQWGFDGAIISDYTAINEMVAHGVGDLRTVALRAVEAGVDLDMVGESYDKFLVDAVEAGDLDESLINEGCRRVLSLKWKAGLFKDPFLAMDGKVAKEVIGSKSTRQEARAMAAASCVLLKNERNALPISGSGVAGSSAAVSGTDEKFRIALIGPLVEDKANLPGTWAIATLKEDSVSLAEGLKVLTSDMLGTNATMEIARGCNLVDDPEMAKRLNPFGVTVTIDPRDTQEMIDEAVELAKRSDVVVLTVGEAKEESGECSSRTSLDLSSSQRRLIDALAEAGTKIVLVVFAGRPIVLTPVLDQVDSILYAWYGGSLAGAGIADVLMGGVAPEGRLTMSLPRNVGQIPVHHDALPTGRPLPPKSEYEKFKSCYLDSSNKPLFPFGYGLSYTEFSSQNLEASLKGEEVTLQVEVSNTGDRDGVEVVQAYLVSPTFGLSQPKLQLVKFERVVLKPGESKTVTFSIGKQDVAAAKGTSLTDVTWEFTPGEYRFGVGRNSEDFEIVTVDWK